MIRTMELPRDARAPAAARRLVEDHLVPVVGADAVATARLLLSEVVTNSVRHGDGPAVRVVLDATDDESLRVEVIDEGHGFVPARRTRPMTDEGGWGLHLVEAMTDRWGVHDGSAHVWFELRRGA